MSPIIISMQVAFPATFFAFLLGLLAAWKVVKGHRFKGLFDGLFTLPMILPPTVVGFFLLLIFGRNGIGQWLSKVGIIIVFNLNGAIIAATVVAFPLMYRAARGAFESLDSNLVDAARVCGASEVRIFWQIIVPNCWPGIASGTVLAFARALGEFGATSMIAGNTPGKTQTMSLAIYSAVQSNERSTAYAWVVVITLISFTTLILMNLFEGGSLRKRSK